MSSSSASASSTSSLPPLQEDVSSSLPLPTVLLDDNRYHVLVEFSYKHLDFQMPELQAVLSMHGIHVDDDDDDDDTEDSSTPHPPQHDDNHCIRFVNLYNQDRFDQVVANDPRYSHNKQQHKNTNNEDIAAASSASTENDDKDEKNETTETTSNHEKQQQQQKKKKRKKSLLHSSNNGSSSSTSGIVPRRPFCILSLPLDSKWIPRQQQQQQQQRRRREDHTDDDDDDDENENDDDSGNSDIATILLSRCVLVRSVMHLYTMGPTMEACAATLASWTSTLTSTFSTTSTSTRLPSSLSSTLLLPPRVAQIMQPQQQQQQQQQTDDDASAAGSSSSWKMTIHTLGATFDRHEHEQFRQLFAPFFQKHPWTCNPGLNPVVMRNPDHEFVLIREVELDAKGGALFPRYDFEKRLIVENDVRPPLCCYFGRRLLCRTNSSSAVGGGTAGGGVGATSISSSRSTGCGSGGRPTNLWEQYSLKKRLYLGPTSMDSELSFIMTNLGHVQAGSMVMDPFVGTGSILLSCALRGAYCVGTDIDLRVLRGTTLDTTAPDLNHYHSPSVPSSQPQQRPQQRPKAQEQQEDCDVFSNFRQFGLPLPDLIRSDNAIYHRHFRRHEPLYDAILCDPPYGIRAGARKSGSRKLGKEQASSAEAAVAPGELPSAPTAAPGAPRPILEEHRSTHIAQTRPYPVQDVMADLLDMAARTLVRGGRLVYIIPSFSDFDAESDLPRHDCLSTVHICYQPLSVELGRHMVAMEKTADYNFDKRDEYLSRVWKNGPASAEKCANIRQKILDAAKIKPGYDEKLAIRKKKRKETRDAKKKAKLNGQITP
jgi:tRNA (guanine10-N2)-methyltransferase